MIFVAMRHVLWTESYWIDLQKAGHIAPTYRQNDSIPNELRMDSYGIATRWLRAGYALATHCTEAITPLWLQPEAKEGSLGPLVIEPKSADEQGIGTTITSKTPLTK